jgi:hypothetical protein
LHGQAWNLPVRKGGEFSFDFDGGILFEGMDQLLRKMGPVLVDACGEGLCVSQKDARGNHGTFAYQLFRQTSFWSVDPRLNRCSFLSVARPDDEIVFFASGVRINHTKRGDTLRHDLKLPEGPLDSLGQHGFARNRKITGEDGDRTAGNQKGPSQVRRSPSCADTITLAGELSLFARRAARRKNPIVTAGAEPEAR